MLFPRGARPSQEAVARALADSDPPTHKTASFTLDAHETLHGVELLHNAMTFHCLGLSEGASHPVPPIHQFLGCGYAEASSSHEAIALRPGPHLAGGEAIRPIMQGWATIAAALATALPDCTALVWRPAALAIGRDPFQSAINEWHAGGPIPAQIFIAFSPSVNGAIRSVGLAHFTGQELRLEPPANAVSDSDADTRLARLIATHLLHHGKLNATEAMTAPDGTTLRLEPSPNGRFIRAWRA